MGVGRRSIFAAALAGLAIAATRPSLAASPVSQSHGYAIGGYDPVAYFLVGRAERGRSEYSYRWRDATWLFASADNRAKFMANPEAYAPQYGGHCTSGMSGGNRYNPDPKAWSIVDGKLYLSGNVEGRTRWMRDAATTISKADQWWKRSYAGQ